VVEPLRVADEAHAIANMVTNRAAIRRPTNEIPSRREGHHLHRSSPVDSGAAMNRQPHPGEPILSTVELLC